MRNDSVYLYRWSSPTFVREFVQNIPYEVSRGYYFGSDGWVWGRDFLDKNHDDPDRLELLHAAVGLVVRPVARLAHSREKLAKRVGRGVAPPPVLAAPPHDGLPWSFQSVRHRTSISLVPV